MSLPAIRRLTHSSPRTLARIPIPISRLPTSASFSLPCITSRVSRASRFSTMSARQSAAAPTAPANKAYDPEIQDMANYVHEYKVDSDLAVC